MRKHNKKFAQRWSRASGDRSNRPQQAAHGVVVDRSFQLFSNGLLRAMVDRALNILGMRAPKAAA